VVLARALLARLIQAALVLLGVSLLSWALSAMAPGDAAEVEARRMAGGTPPTAEQVQHMRVAMGLDQPVATQYARWVGRLLQGDFGASFATGRPVAHEIWRALPSTIALTAAALLLLLTIGVPLGTLAALQHERLADFSVRLLALLCGALPSYWLGLLLILCFAVQLGWLPSGGGGSARHLVLPALTLALGGAGAYARLMRAALREHMSAEHVRAARARGLAARQVFVRHVLRHAALPVVAQCGLSVGGLLGGAVVVETIFAWPGIGLLAVDAAQAHDVPLLQGVVLVGAAAYLAASLLVDGLSLLLDPRLSRATPGAP
jgi:ABC-type dipeptide/oligopeptide/nickel transport system permease component